MRIRFAASLALAALSACTTWQNVPVQTGASPNAVRDTAVVGEYAISDDRRGVRVRLASGQEVSFRALAIHGDTLYGFTGPADSLALPRDSVRSVAVRKVSYQQNAALGVVGAIASIALAV